LPVSVIRRTAAQLLDTFAFLHGLDVIHGDLKVTGISVQLPKFSFI